MHVPLYLHVHEKGDRHSSEDSSQIIQILIPKLFIATATEEWWTIQTFMVAEINHDAREERHAEATQKRAHLGVQIILLNPVPKGIYWLHNIGQRQQQQLVVDNYNGERKQKHLDTRIKGLR